MGEEEGVSERGLCGEEGRREGAHLVLDGRQADGAVLVLVLAVVAVVACRPGSEESGIALSLLALLGQLLLVVKALERVLAPGSGCVGAVRRAVRGG